MGDGLLLLQWGQSGNKKEEEKYEAEKIRRKRAAEASPLPTIG